MRLPFSIVAGTVLRLFPHFNAHLPLKSLGNITMTLILSTHSKQDYVQNKSADIASPNIHTIYTYVWYYDWYDSLYTHEIELNEIMYSHKYWHSFSLADMYRSFILLAGFCKGTIQI